MKKKFLALVVLSCVGFLNAQQLENNSFESWTSSGLYKPIGWNTDFMGVKDTSISSEGEKSALVFVKLFGGQYYSGLLYYGNYDSNNSFICKAYNGSPNSLKFDYQWHPGSSNDFTGVILRLKSGNVIIQETEVLLTDPQTSFQTYTIDLPGQQIDSVFIAFGVKEEANPNSKFVVDNVRFIESSNSINTIVDSDIVVSPNPFTNGLKLSNLPKGKKSIQIIDGSGRELFIRDNVYSESINLDTDFLISGCYTLLITHNLENKVYKILKY